LILNPDKFLKVQVSSRQELWDWLEFNCNQSESVWLVTFKKVRPENYVSREEVLDALIAFGWIDGVRSQVDEMRTMQLISPRKTKPWAKSYKLRAQKLIAAGLMKPSGMAEIEKALKSGGWDEMNDVDDLVLPDDLHSALSSNGLALTYFEDFPMSIKRNILRWIASAKTEQTRAKRIQMTANEAKDNKRVQSHS
jgi:uncharacterized protein YdeI (YjbR/CyaY-like superfamily)